MAIWTIGGRETSAALMLGENFFLGVGEGDPAWDGAPVAPLTSDRALVAPVGVTRLRDIQFVTPDANGSISMADGAKFSVSANPTKFVYMYFLLGLSDADGFTLREDGIFHGTTLDGAVPGGDMYIPDASVTDYGTLMQVDRFNSIVRDGTLEQKFSFVITL